MWHGIVTDDISILYVSPKKNNTNIYMYIYCMFNVFHLENNDLIIFFFNNTQQKALSLLHTSMAITDICGFFGIYLELYITCSDHLTREEIDCGFQHQRISSKMVHVVQDIPFVYLQQGFSYRHETQMNVKRYWVFTWLHTSHSSDTPRFDGFVANGEIPCGWHFGWKFATS